jgi:dynein heavy chain
MLISTADVVTNEETLISLWKHECCRVIADRFVSHDDRSWFEKTLKQVKILLRIVDESSQASAAN